ncbi:MAG: hypothetical protein MSC50_06470 [Campylobacter sp.]|uniref:hypothetical protein n=1 Tax=Campylobacter sp. TaxID=205 RepID=UPI002AA678F5|nr:hypothetical protein [Campylobacter sp.]MCI6579897.1 hypothetical protein [Campylobacter sp.]
MQTSRGEPYGSDLKFFVPIFQAIAQKNGAKNFKRRWLSSCDFVAINAQAEPAEFKNQPIKS